MGQEPAWPPEPSTSTLAPRQNAPISLDLGAISPLGDGMLSPGFSSASTTPTLQGPPGSAAQGKRRFPCTFAGCDKSFTTSGHLARHARIHTGERSFQCTFDGCQSRFSRHDNMLQHYRGHISKNSRCKKGASTPRSVKGKARAAAAHASGLSSSPVFVQSQYNTIHPQPPPLHLGGPPMGQPYNHFSGFHSSSSTHSSPSSLQLSFGSNDMSYANMVTGPPLASPSVIERPRSAIEPFYDFSNSYFPIPGPQTTMQPVRPQPPALTHRHSYSALPLYPSEPITPLEEFENPLPMSSVLGPSSPYLSPHNQVHLQLVPDPRLGSGMPVPLQQTHQMQQLQYVQQLPPVPSTASYMRPQGPSQSQIQASLPSYASSGITLQQQHQPMAPHGMMAPSATPLVTPQQSYGMPVAPGYFADPAGARPLLFSSPTFAEAAVGMSAMQLSHSPPQPFMVASPQASQQTGDAPIQAVPGQVWPAKALFPIDTNQERLSHSEPQSPHSWFSSSNSNA